MMEDKTIRGRWAKLEGVQLMLKMIPEDVQREAKKRALIICDEVLRSMTIDSPLAEDNMNYWKQIEQSIKEHRIPN